MLFGLENQTYAQYLSNGSFEIHRVGKYPNGHTGNKQQNYHINELMKCINLCNINQHPNIQYPPTTCFIENGWYSPTVASPDYYHVFGSEGTESKLASIPRNRSWNRLYTYINQGPPDQTPTQFTNLYDTLYPYNYIGGHYNEYLDSAYAAIGIRVKNNDGNIYQVAYKEYLQVKLSQPLTAGVYKVTYWVSRSKNTYKYVNSQFGINHDYGNTLKSLCALFSHNSIIAPHSSYFSPPYEWENNLTWSFQSPYDYIFENISSGNTVCSNELLTKTTGYPFSDNWQKISDIIVVPQDSSYYYLTIGNFQTDDEIIEDLKKINGKKLLSDNPEEYFYYFIDNIEITGVNPCSEYTCDCSQSTVPFEITKNYQNEDSTKCYYDYKFEIPFPPINSLENGICPISKILIKMDNEVIWGDSVEIFPFHFDTGIYTGCFCLDKFSSQYNKTFTLLFYRKIYNSDQDTILSQCSREVKLNCICSCPDMDDYPYPKLKPSVSLKKSSLESQDTCCWDIVINNPYNINSTSCEFDLSNKVITMKIDSNYQYYDFTAENGFNYSYSPGLNYKYFEASSNFKIKPGEQKIIGRICSKGITGDHRLSFNMFIGNSFEEADTCTRLISQTLKCDSAITNCCDLISIDFKQNVNSALFLGCDDHDGNFTPEGYCCFPIFINFSNTPTNCFYGDFLRIVIYDEDNQGNVLFVDFLDFSNMYFSRKLLRWLKVPAGTSRNICVEVKNLRNQETCLYCDSLSCPEFDTEGLKEKEIELFKKSERIDESTEIKVFPNPASKEIELKLYFDLETTAEIVLLTNDLQEVFQKQYLFKIGENRIFIPTDKIVCGSYLLNLVIGGKVVSKKIIILK